jgi:hypothetical protein
VTSPRAVHDGVHDTTCFVPVAHCTTAWTISVPARTQSVTCVWPAGHAAPPLVHAQNEAAALLLVRQQVAPPESAPSVSLHEDTGLTLVRFGAQLHVVPVASCPQCQPREHVQLPEPGYASSAQQIVEPPVHEAAPTTVALPEPSVTTLHVHCVVP